MALGDRNIKVGECIISNTDPVEAVVSWSLKVESAGGEVGVSGGSTKFALGPKASAKNLTIQQVFAQALAAVDADPKVPAKENIS